MELYLDVRTIGKGEQGRTACGSAAYRSCSKVIDNDGVVHTFKNKKGYVCGGIVLPEGAPEELRDVQTLWQRHDAKEIRKDAQIYREMIVSFPNELSDEACANVMQKLIQPLADMGMCAQWDIHNPHKKEPGNKKPENKHGHVMLSMRELLSDGTFGKKVRKWNRYNGGINLADLLRPEAARLMNEELAKIGSTQKVEHESFEARGIDQIPTVHVGVQAKAMAEKGKITYKVELNKRIREINKLHISYFEKLQEYRAARAEMTELVLKRSEERPSLLDEVIGAAERIRKSTNERDADKAPQAPSAERIYQEIKLCNRQLYALKIDKKKTDRVKEALYLVKNLAGDPGLDVEQEKRLNWALGYLQWAGMKDLGPEAVYKKIDELHQDNVQRHLEIGQLNRRKELLYKEARVAKQKEKQSFTNHKRHEESR